MKGTSMAARWRTIRVFLDENGVDEVDWDMDSPKSLRCTCPQFARNASKKCKHIVYLLREAREAGGSIQVRVDKDQPDAAVHEALKDAEQFRTLVLHHSPIVVL